jgi:hypothetical protein
MFAFMSGTSRVSGGLLHCNMTYMPLVNEVVKAILLRRSKFFMSPRAARDCNLNIGKTTLIRHSSLPGVTQFDLLGAGEAPFRGRQQGWLA